MGLELCPDIKNGINLPRKTRKLIRKLCYTPSTYCRLPFLMRSILSSIMPKYMYQLKDYTVSKEEKKIGQLLYFRNHFYMWESFILNPKGWMYFWCCIFYAPALLRGMFSVNSFFDTVEEKRNKGQNVISENIRPN